MKNHFWSKPILAATLSLLMITFASPVPFAAAEIDGFDSGDSSSVSVPTSSNQEWCLTTHTAPYAGSWRQGDQNSNSYSSADRTSGTGYARAYSMGSGSQWTRAGVAGPGYGTSGNDPVDVKIWGKLSATGQHANGRIGSGSTSSTAWIEVGALVWNGYNMYFEGTRIATSTLSGMGNHPIALSGTNYHATTFEPGKTYYPALAGGTSVYSTGYTSAKAEIDMTFEWVMICSPGADPSKYVDMAVIIMVT